MQQECEAMRYVFGAYTLDMQRDELRAAAEVVQLDRQVFTVLAYLVQYRDRVVPRQELFEQLWPERFVSEAALERCIAIARKAIGDSGRTQQVIQTVHGRGYRFVAPVEEHRNALPDTTPPAPLPAPPLLESGLPPLPEVAASPATSASPLPVSPSSPIALLSPRQPLPTGERRQITVLCGTLAHTIALANRFGLEAYRHLVQTFHTLAQDCVQRYEGTVQTLREDGVLALFGVPMAQEEHAWRAVQAALELRQRLREVAPEGTLLPGEVLTARVGVHTGWVVVGSHQDEPLQAVVIGGDTTQGAMHLQALAEPGTLMMSDMTLRLLRATVHSKAYGMVRVPGYTDPLIAYTVQGMETSHVPRVWSPFVGRQRELAVFDDLLARVLAGQGQVVGLIGEPGIGKSRLVSECRQRLSGEPVTVLEGYCRSYERFLPYGPIIDLLRQQCGLSAAAPSDIVATRLDHLLRAMGLSPEEDAPYLLLLLGGSTTAGPLTQLAPDVIKARTFATLRRLHLRSSQQQPLLLVVENLHWIDPTSEAYLTSLVEHLAGVPLLLLTTYRPGYHPPRMDKSYATQLTLPRLTYEESAMVARALLPSEHYAEPLIQRVLARAEGNPLFLEELSQAVREQEGLVADATVPETLQAVLAARMDHLPAEAKHLLLTAAVIGPEVPVPLLEAIAELPEDVLHRSLAALQAAEFLYGTRLLPEQVYTFKHTLTHEVAYGSLLLERRRVLHACILETLETLAGEQVAGQVERLAYHALRGEAWGKAVVYCQQAGEKALARSAHREAVGHFEQALGALTHRPEQRATREQAIDLRLALRSALQPSNDLERILTYLHEAEALAAALDDQHRLARISLFLSRYFSLIGAYDQAIPAAQRALALAATSGDSILYALAHLKLGLAYQPQGDYRHAIDCLGQTVMALDRARRCERFGEPILPAVQSRAWLAWCHAELGTFAVGRVLGDEGLRIAKAVDHPGSLMVAPWGGGLLAFHQGDLCRALPQLELAMGICQDTDLPIWFPRIATTLGAAYTLGGRVADAILLLTQAMEQSVTVKRGGRPESICGLALGEAYLLASRLEEAHVLAERALALARALQHRGSQAYALRLLGEIYVQGKPLNVTEAEAYYQQPLTLAEELGMRPLQAHCHRGLGTLYAKLGQREQARAALSMSIELYSAMEMTFWLPEAKAALAQVA
jgi:DNA-binding winged helix-turn-helix (wHTH) protein/class 3 adenylate cyclase/tetratricopeptide (TPR) repeat protein